MVSTHVVSKKTYTAELFQYYPGIGWSSLMNSCYSVAKKVTVGGGIPRVGSVFRSISLFASRQASSKYSAENYRRINARRGSDALPRYLFTAVTSAAVTGDALLPHDVRM